MDESVLTANVYEAPDFSGIDNDYLWDFGAFVCVGTESYPRKSTSGYDVYDAVVTGRDVDWRNQQEATVKETTFYEFDYGVYVPIDVVDVEYARVEHEECSSIRGIRSDGVVTDRFFNGEWFCQFEGEREAENGTEYVECTQFNGEKKLYETDSFLEKFEEQDGWEAVVLLNG